MTVTMPQKGATSATPDQETQETRRVGVRRHRLLHRRMAEDPSAESIKDPTPQFIAPPAPRGARFRASSRKAARGYYSGAAIPAPATTAQARILNPALIAPPTDNDGICIGRDTMSNLPVAHDPFVAYGKKIITSPNVIVLGNIGSGKSSLLKTVYCLRPLVLRKRRVFVMDKKDQGGEGEYAELTRRYGTEPYRFRLGSGGTKINPLDPQLLFGSDRSAQLRLLAALAENALGGRVLDQWEKLALSDAHRLVLRKTEQAERVPLLMDLVPALGQVSEERRKALSPQASERLHQAGLSVRWCFELMLTDELAGLFDGPTSQNVLLSDKLTTFDVSQLPEDGPAIGMLIAVANVWLMGMLRHDRGWLTNFIAEEGWHLVDGPGGRLFRSNSKLARGLGLSNIAAMHHPSDVPAGSPGEAMLKEADTIHIFRQERDEDVEACMRMYALGRSSKHTLMTLPTGHHLLKIGPRRELHVEHVRSQFEIEVTDTDAAMTAKEAS